MRILLVIDGMHPRDGGPPAVVAGSAVALSKRGHEVRVLTTLLPGDQAVVEKTWQGATALGVRLVYCEPVGVMALLGAGEQEAALRTEIQAAQVIHLHGIWNPLLWLSARLARAADKPYLVSVHGTLDHRALRRTRPKWVKKRVAIELFGIRRFLDRAAAVVFGSEAEATQSWMMAPRMRLAYIPNGVAAAVDTQAPQDEALNRLQAIAPAFSQWRRSLLFFSRIHPEKGLDMLVAAFDRVAPDFPDVGLLIAGLKQDLAFQAQIEAMIATSDSRDRMVLTTELVGPGSQFLYTACDVFVLPSHAEGFSMALTEAMARGRPILATTFCHMPELVHRKAGVVVEPSVDGIERGLRSLLSLTDAELAEMGQRSRAMFLDKYTWERVSVALEAAYLDACGCTA